METGSYSEAEIQKQIIDYLKLSGCMVFRLNSGRARSNIRLCPPGTPDLLAVNRQGIIWWIEVKKPGGVLRPDQEKILCDLSERGQKTVVAYSLADVDAVVR